MQIKDLLYGSIKPSLIYAFPLGKRGRISKILMQLQSLTKIAVVACHTSKGGIDESKNLKAFVAKGLFFIFCVPTLCNAWLFSFEAPKKPFMLMIEASGDSTHMGRIIDDSFENSITFELAQTLKNRLMALCPNAKIIINRALGETVMPLQNANFANKLDIDLYLSLHAFTETEAKPRIFIFQFSYQDSFIAKDSMSFYPFDKIYLVHEAQTAQWAQSIYQTLSQNQSVQTKKAAKIPFKPLIGIKAPSIGLELGLKNKANWHDYLDDLAQSIAIIINNK